MASGVYLFTYVYAYIYLFMYIIGYIRKVSIYKYKTLVSKHDRAN
jgi:hypothetical protein